MNPFKVNDFGLKIQKRLEFLMNILIPIMYYEETPSQQKILFGNYYAILFVNYIKSRLLIDIINNRDLI
jgi:hypothetical protein